MSTEVLLALALLAWISFGPLLAVVMGRRGHSTTAWGAIGTLLGPLAVPIAIENRWRRRDAALEVLVAAPPHGGPVSVLAGIDGSDEARAALGAAVRLLGDRIDRLTLASVLSYDTADDHVALADGRATAGLWMAAAQAAIPDVEADEVIVVGQPAPALQRLAVSGGYDLVVVGPRGHGMSPRLFGSVAKALAEGSPVPILVGGQGGPAPLVISPNARTGAKRVESGA